jgi:hypothetical protein
MASQRHKVVVQGVAADGSMVAEGEAAYGYWGPNSPGYPVPPADVAQVIRVDNAVQAKVYLDANDYPDFDTGDLVNFAGVGGTGGATFMSFGYSLGAGNSSESSFILRTMEDDADIDLSANPDDLTGGQMLRGAP